MQLETSLIADSASDYQGRLCVLGAFDSIMAPVVPASHPHCSVVVRVRFERSEEGKHSIRLVLIDQDGRQQGPRLDGEINVVVPPNAESYAANFILNINGLTLPTFGTYHYDLTIDGNLKSRMPIHVVQINQMKKAA